MRKDMLTFRNEWQCEVINISRSGFAFYSNSSIEPGNLLMMELGNLIAIESTVLACEMEETNADLMEMKYRIRCHFNNEDYGLRFLLFAKQVEQESAPISIKIN